MNPNHPKGRFNPYPACKPSGVPWLGDVPGHWEMRRLRTVADVINGATPSTNNAELWDGDIPWITPDDLGQLSGSYIAEGSRSITEVGYRSCATTIAPPGSVAISTRAPIGHIGILLRHGCVNQGCRLLVPKKNIQSKFLYYQLSSAQFELQSLGQGSTFMELSRGKLADFAIPLPPLPEQAAIVRYLDHADRRIQRYIDGKERLIALLEEEKQAIINQAVTSGLDPNVPLKPSGVQWLGDVPAHWGMGRLKSQVYNISDHTYRAADNEFYVALEHVESWTGRIAVPDHDVVFESQVKRFRAGDVLFGKLRPYLAKVTRPDREGVCVGEFLVFRPRTPTLSNAYLELLARSKPFVNAVDASTFGAKMPRADWAFIGNMNLPMPPAREQEAIVAYLSTAVGNVDKATSAARRQIELLREYRTCLTADVVTGKLDVREAAAQLPEEGRWN